MDLSFTPKGVSELENQFGISLPELVAVFKMDVLVRFVSKGTNTPNIDAAFQLIADYIATSTEDDQKDTMTLQVLIISKLEEQGFLPKALKLSQKIQSKIDQMGSQSSLEDGGEKTNQVPSA